MNIVAENYYFKDIVAVSKEIASSIGFIEGVETWH